MADEYTPWILDTLEEAAQEWDNTPEWTKPYVNAPYFAQRSDMLTDQDD